MFGFVMKIFVSAIMFFGCNVSNVNQLNTVPLNAVPLRCVSINIQDSKIRPEKININSNEPLFYPYNIKVNKYIGSCNSINDLYSKLCVPDVVKNMKKERHIKRHKTCKSKCRLDASVCNNKQHWNNNKCRECKELIGKRICDKGFIWNPSNCECECDKSCDVGEHLDIKIVSVEKG